MWNCTVYLPVKTYSFRTVLYIYMYEPTHVGLCCAFNVRAYSFMNVLYIYM